MLTTKQKAYITTSKVTQFKTSSTKRNVTSNPLTTWKLEDFGVFSDYVKLTDFNKSPKQATRTATISKMKINDYLRSAYQQVLFPT